MANGWEWINRTSALVTLSLGLPAIVGAIATFALPSFDEALAVSFLILGALFFSVNIGVLLTKNSSLDALLTNGCEAKVILNEAEFGIRIAVVLHSFASRVMSYTVEELIVIADGRTQAAPELLSKSGLIGPGDRRQYWYPTIYLDPNERQKIILGTLEISYSYGFPRSKRWKSSAKYEFRLGPNVDGTGYDFEWSNAFDV